MLDEMEAARIKKVNYKKVKELIRISFGLGVNLTSPSRFKDSLRIINVILVLGSFMSIYGQLCFTVRYFGNISKIAESFSTTLQTLISAVKMVYYLFVQRQLWVLLNKTQTHEFIRQIEILHKDFPINGRLQKKIDEIMEDNWKGIRGQLIFYIVCCSSIISNYFFGALFVNLYHDLKGTPNYRIVLPFPALFPQWEEQGTAFPYYEIQMFFGFCASYIAGMTAVSFDGVFIVLSVHSVGLIKVLNVMIENSTSDDVPQERRVEYFRYCIDQYQRITDYLDEIRLIYKHISISQFLLSLVILGVVMFQMSVGLESDKITLIRMLMYISAAGYEVVLYCYNSQRITTECEQIPVAIYSCKWYNESEEFKVLVRMLLVRTGRMFYMDISWFTTMTLPTLMAMIKTSGSYFLLLRNLAE